MTVYDTGPGTNAFARLTRRVPLWLAKHLWVWPLMAALVLGLVGLWVHHRVEWVTQAELASRLKTLLQADVAALRLWFSEQQADAKSFAADVRIQGAIVELAALESDTNVSPVVLQNSAAATSLRYYLEPLLESQHYVDYVVIGADRRILASPYRHWIGHPAPASYRLFLERALAGQVPVSRPFSREQTASQRAEGPTMFVASPVRSAGGKVVGVLALRMKPEAEFSQIFSVARMGRTGEAYAFDHRGVMLTASRFEREIKRLGLIPNAPEDSAILNLRLADPGVDLARQMASNHAAAARVKVPSWDLPLTRMAAAATGGENGVDVQGYRNYRGIMVVGAWAWLPEYGMGVATEVATEEAFQTLGLLQNAFLVLMLLSVLGSAVIFAFTVAVERLQASIRKSALAARRLGQYVLLQEIGRGANGMVYRARHSFLRRPVAIKLLSPELTNATTIADFEREVQMTSQLTHPNTVAVYDYGRTPEGLFYYAMEFLSGIDLDQLVRRFGLQPEGRVIHLLRQVCGSLAEAHQVGLIHRDIKPANIVLTRRGGLCDIVKVLDFGLVKPRQPGARDRQGASPVVGTPHFMAPEAIATPASVDARSDLYSVGALGYWLLTGCTLFDSDDIDHVLERHVNEKPITISERLGRSVDTDLEKIIMCCLSKSPAARPANAGALDRSLADCLAASAWTEAAAEAWWQEHARSFEVVQPTPASEKTMVIAPR